jgi:uroporphyrin-III C-methyltransferase/precorrin-2 dehydrogenase/sirohydrochlorin ferrochelatase
MTTPVPGPPDWLRARLFAGLGHLGHPAGPDAAIAAIAARHQRSPGEVVLAGGARDALALLARSLPPQHAACAGPACAGPACAGPATADAATILRAAGHDVRSVPLTPDGTLDAGQVPDEVDLVVVAGRAGPGGMPDLERLARPGRILVVDETQRDGPDGPAGPGASASADAARDLPGLVVIRDLASVWGLDGLGAGYLLGDATLVGRLRAAQPSRPVSTLALIALEACSQPDAVAWAAGQASRAPQIAAPDAGAQQAGASDGASAPGTAPTPGTASAGAPGSGPAAGAGSGTSISGTGTVTLIGAGPGGSDLITMRGWLALHEADVVVADRLADPGLTRQLRPGVLLINAGKAPGAQQLSQDQINGVLTEHARAGRRVARLKGGDPFVFGRGGEEAAACAAAGIACTVIPGLSSALAGPALAGIPVTHREIGQSFTVVSGHLPPDHPDSRVDWKALAGGSDTLVLLMAVRNLGAIAGHLVACGTPPETPAACVQDAGTGRQQVFRSTLGGLADPAAAPPVRNPAVIIIGPTAGHLSAADPAGELVGGHPGPLC